METHPQMKRRHIAERETLIRNAFRVAKGNASEAARLIDMNRGAMLRLIRTHGIQVVRK